ncbi:hypothetical protein [Bifidobacterium aemilianum]|nr:hypothetical protein [Bifidobacterium aemilianum]
MNSPVGKDGKDGKVRKDAPKFLAAVPAPSTRSAPCLTTRESPAPSKRTICTAGASTVAGCFPDS